MVFNIDLSPSGPPLEGFCTHIPTAFPLLHGRGRCLQQLHQTYAHEIFSFMQMFKNMQNHFIFFLPPTVEIKSFFKKQYSYLQYYEMTVKTSNL